MMSGLYLDLIVKLFKKEIMMTNYEIVLLNKLTIFTGILLIPLIMVTFCVTVMFFSEAIGRRGSYKSAWDTYKIPIVLVYSITFIDLLIFRFIPTF